MLSSVVAFVTLTPTAKFLALSPNERVSTLERIVAPIQEWTGASGGLFFGERATFNDGRWVVVLGLNILVPELGEVFQKAMQDARGDGYFAFWGIAGENLQTVSGDENASKLAMDHIFEQFLG